MREIFGEVSGALLFKYQTIDALVDFFIVSRKDTLIEITGLTGQLSSEETTSFRKPQREAPPAFIGARLGRARGMSTVRASHAEDKSDPPIAIIGISGRYPQAMNMDEYWKNLKEGKDCIVEIPASRWPLEDFYHPNPEEAVAQGNKSYSKWGGFVDGVDQFDPLFFNISPQEATFMDPQRPGVRSRCPNSQKVTE